jgi:hypothetical protein
VVWSGFIWLRIKTSGMGEGFGGRIEKNETSRKT